MTWLWDNAMTLSTLVMAAAAIAALIYAHLQIAENKRAEILNLYNFDGRAAPWKGTAYGVAMAYNTWGQHFRAVRKGVPRSVRNMESLVSGKTANEDSVVLDVLSDVTGMPIPV